jgi:hypothetical protein
MFAVMVLITVFLFVGWMGWCWAVLEPYINPPEWVFQRAPLSQMLPICFFGSFPFLLSLVITYQLW